MGGDASTITAPWHADRNGSRSTSDKRDWEATATSESRRSTSDKREWEATATSEGRRLFIGQIQNLPAKDVEDRLWRIFKAFGHIEDLQYLQLKSVAYVTYKREKDARWAQKDTDGKQYY